MLNNIRLAVTCVLLLVLVIVLIVNYFGNNKFKF